MSTKPQFTLLNDPLNASGLAKFYEKITGKRPSPAEVAKVQRMFDEHRGVKHGGSVKPKG